MRIQDSRIKIKRSTTASEVPTVPTSDDNTDGSWLSTDIYKGEFFKNLVDGLIYTRVDSGILEVMTANSTAITNAWSKAGNTLASRGKLGSTSGAYGVDFYVNNSIYGSLLNDGKWSFGASSAFTDTYLSVKGHGNTSSTYAQQWQNSSGTVNGWVRNDGIIQAQNGFNLGSSTILRYNSSSRSLMLGPSTFTMANASNFGIGPNNMANIVNGYNNVVLGDACGNGIVNGYSNIFVGFNVASAAYDSAGCILFGQTSSIQKVDCMWSQAYGTNATLRNDNELVFGSNGGREIKNIYFGAGQGNGSTLVTSFNPVYIHSQGDCESVANKDASASKLYLRGARSRGTANTAGVIIQSALPTGSGTTLQTYFDALTVEGHTGNIGVGSSPSFGSGVGVIGIKDAPTDSSANPTSGTILQSKSGRLRVYETDGSLSYVVKSLTTSKTTAAAPYTNDGYIEVIINGTTYKLMTTA